MARGPVETAGLTVAIAAFHRRHERLYTFAQEDTPVELVTLRVDEQASFRCRNCRSCRRAAIPALRS